MKNSYQLSPYLNFDGKCAEAMEFYHKIFGGKLDIQRFGDAPMQTPEDQKNRVMHATLTNDIMSFMASDTQPGTPFNVGNNVHLSLAGTDEKMLTEIFNKLAAGGTTTMPLAKQFWGDTFGMLTDKFGINWMVNIGSMGK